MTFTIQQLSDLEEPETAGANQPGTRNLMGVASPAVDAMVTAMDLGIKGWKALVTACS